MVDSEKDGSVCPNYAQRSPSGGQTRRDEKTACMLAGYCWRSHLGLGPSRRGRVLLQRPSPSCRDAGARVVVYYRWRSGCCHTRACFIVDKLTGRANQPRPTRPSVSLRVAHEADTEALLATHTPARREVLDRQQRLKHPPITRGARRQYSRTESMPLKHPLEVTPGRAGFSGPVWSTLLLPRGVSLGRRGTIIAIPGTGGICLEIAHFDTDRSGLGRADRLAASGRANGFGADQGSCTPAAHDPFYPSGRGIFIGWSHFQGPGNASGSWTVLGLVPDGNRTVMVDLKSHRTVKVRVKQNIVFGDFTARPTAIIYESAAGHVITLRLGHG
jgi:hypothetical protein